MNEEIVRVERVSKRFEHAWAVRDLSFTLRRNEILGLLADQGLIAKGYGRVDILDVEGLRALCRPT